MLALAARPRGRNDKIRAAPFFAIRHLSAQDFSNALFAHSRPPHYAFAPPPTSALLISFVKNVLPMGLVIFAVVGLILLGWATPTESAAFGVLSVLVLAVFMRCLNWAVLVQSVRGAGRAIGSARAARNSSWSAKKSADPPWRVPVSTTH